MYICIINIVCIVAKAWSANQVNHSAMHQSPLIGRQFSQKIDIPNPLRPKKYEPTFQTKLKFLTRIFTQANNVLGKAAHSDDFQIIFCGDLHLEMIERAIEQKRGLEFYLHLIHNELERGRQKMPQMMNWPQNMQILFSTTDKWIQADFGQLYNISCCTVQVYIMLHVLCINEWVKRCLKRWVR